ncbi:methionyl-tRNA formyltransferase [Campylobacter concisus]|uniref:formyltransferase family protein n=1 Tax=Campylobacter concisus TaxID=199 RepID=UPI0018AB4AEB|nr:formyltransferase family protein [Campylobacter concisus]QPH98685.1 methionyl-tRNA formyltransferase [Campylobacter concisus]QPI00478.1 methionyl-tRNA formyltransferase [Campylobacter concisus]
MKILFIGTVEFSYKVLKKLIELNAEIVGICTKKKSDFNSDFADLTPLCKKAGIPFKYIDDINSNENIAWIRSLSPDIIFCFGWSNLIKKDLLGLPKMGVVGYHPALLPKNRGRHPLIWALALGLNDSGSTFFFMTEGADDGDILSQEKIEILYEDDAKSLYNKVSNVALKQIETFLPKLQNNSFKTIKQNNDLANVWRKRGKVDGKIDFRMTSRAIYNLVRALTKPYVGAHVEYNGQDISIWKVEEVEFDQNNIEFGKVLENDGKSIVVKTYDKAIKIIDHDFKELPKVGKYI